MLSPRTRLATSPGLDSDTSDLSNIGNFLLSIYSTPGNNVTIRSQSLCAYAPELDAVLRDYTSLYARC